MRLNNSRERPYVEVVLCYIGGRVNAPSAPISLRVGWEWVYTRHDRVEQMDELKIFWIPESISFQILTSKIKSIELY